MTLTDICRPVPARSGVELIADQLDGLDRWHKIVHARLAAAKTAEGTREMRLDSRRRMDALRRAQQALLSHADSRIEESRSVLNAGPARGIIVHRSDWVRAKLALALEEHGLTVVASETDGADGLGVAVIEQPDLLIIEERLPSISGPELVRSTRELSPHTVVAAQVESVGGVGDLLDAGAMAVFSRRVTPAKMAEQVVDYLRNRPDEYLLMT